MSSRDKSFRYYSDDAMSSRDKPFRYNDDANEW